MGVELTLQQNLEVYYDVQNGHKLRAVKKVKDWTGEGLKECKEYCDFIFDKFDAMSLKLAKIIGDSLESLNENIAQQIIGFAIRDIPEPSGYIQVYYQASISQLVAYYTIKSDEDLIIHKINDDSGNILYISGKYFRFKKEIEETDKPILKL